MQTNYSQEDTSRHRHQSACSLMAHRKWRETRGLR